MNSGPIYRDRTDAGAKLAPLLSKYATQPGVIVLGLPRGGVPVAYEVARALACELDVLIVRKLGTPGQEELAMGAIASGGVRVLNASVIRGAGVSPEQIEEAAHQEAAELKRREAAYRARKAPLDVAGRTVIVVDDGLATGTTMLAALQALRSLRPKRLVVAVPVGAADTCRALQREVDELVCPLQPQDLVAVGCCYADFRQTTDAEVRALLEQGNGGRAGTRTPDLLRVKQAL